MKHNVAILGATGAVGQRFIQMLQDHPWFDIVVVAASERSAGKKFNKVCNWRMETEMPKKIGDLTVVSTRLDALQGEGNIDFIFSALPGNIAGPIEEKLASQYSVISKANAHRMDSDVPLIIPEVNPDHLNLIPFQKEKRGWKGFISTDPNCSTIQLALTVKPLMDFGVKSLIVSTMQALSGAGYPGVPSLDIIDNVVPYIKGEEEKIERETKKILGNFCSGKIQPAEIAISASCNRVNVKDGHLEDIYVNLEQEVDIESIKKAFENFKGEPQKLGLPTAPERPIVVVEEENRPQPRFDRHIGNGMSVVVGRLRSDPIMTIKYVCLGHNTIRGAAGAGILSAELMTAKGIL